jgi:hypothetical protein
MERAHGRGHFTGETSQHEGRRLTSSKIPTRPHPSHGRPASGQARVMHAMGPGTRPRRWLGAPSPGVSDHRPAGRRSCMQRSLATVPFTWQWAGWGCSGVPRRARLISQSGLAPRRCHGAQRVRCCIRLRPHDQVSQRLHGTLSLRPSAGRLRSKLCELPAEPGSQHELTTSGPTGSCQ